MLPEDIRELKDYVERNRSASTPFDICVGGRARLPDWEQDRDHIRSVAQAGQPANEQSMFPVLLNGEFVAAPPLDPKADLLQAPDAGIVQLILASASQRMPSHSERPRENAPLQATRPVPAMAHTPT